MEEEPVEEENPTEWNRYQRLFPDTHGNKFQDFVEVDSGVITTYYHTDDEKLNSLTVLKHSNK